MKKKLGMMMLVCVLVQGMAGCTGTQSQNETDGQNSTAVSQGGEHTGNSSENYAPESGLRSPAYEDGIYANGNGSIVESEKGFYYSNMYILSYFDENINEQAALGSEQLMYFDKAAETALVLCGKPDCDHSTTDCIANAGNLQKKTLCADDNNLYYISAEKNISDEAAALIRRYQRGESSESLGVEQVNYTSDFYLYRMKKDGTQKDRLVKLASAMNTYYFLPEDEIREGKPQEESGSVNISGMAVIDGKLYYCLECMGEVSLNRLELGSQKIEVLEKYEKERVMGLTLCHSGDYIWTQVQCAVDGMYQADIHAYRMDTGESKIICTGIRDARALGMMADQGQIYYASEGVMWTMDYETAEKKELAGYDTGLTYYSPVPYDNYLIVNRMDKIEIYSRDGVFVKEVLFTEGDVSNGGQMMMPYIALIGISEEGIGYVRYDDCSPESMNKGGTVYSFDVNEAIQGEVHFKKLF